MAAVKAALFNKDKVNKMHAWKNKEIVDNFLTNTRNAIPFGGEQLDLLLRIVSQYQRSIKNFIDLGCGDGILANTILAQYPMANGLLIDYSPEMVKAAKSRLAKYDNQRIVQSDLATCEWKHHINDNPECVISGLAIHHLKNGRKYELFEEIYEILQPGGIFINLEHVASASSFGTALFDELMVDTLYNKLLHEGNHKTKEELIEAHRNRSDQYDNILLSVTTQCEWLKEIGFIDVDCFFKCFELSIYAGVKPERK